MVIGRDRDLPSLQTLGEVNVFQEGSGVRWDRTYMLAELRAETRNWRLQIAGPPRACNESKSRGPDDA